MQHLMVGYEIRVTQEKDGAVVGGSIIAIMDVPGGRYGDNAPETYRANIFTINPPECLGQTFRGMAADSDDRCGSDKNHFDMTRQLLQLMAQNGDAADPRYAYVIQRIMAVMTDLTAQIVSRRIKAMVDMISDQHQRDVPAYSAALVDGFETVLNALEIQIHNLPNSTDCFAPRKGAQTAVANANAAIAALRGLWKILDIARLGKK